MDASTFLSECQRVSERHAPARPCKDGRHEILADCRRSVFFPFSSSRALPSSSRAKQGFCCSCAAPPSSSSRVVRCRWFVTREGNLGVGTYIGFWQRTGDRCSHAERLGDWDAQLHTQNEPNKQRRSLPIIDTLPLHASHHITAKNVSCNQLAKNQQRMDLHRRSISLK